MFTARYGLGLEIPFKLSLAFTVFVCQRSGGILQDSSFSTLNGYWLVSSVNAVTVYWLDSLCSILRRFILLSSPHGEELQSGDRPVPPFSASRRGAPVWRPPGSARCTLGDKAAQRQFGRLAIYRYCFTYLQYMMIKVQNQLYFLICRRFFVSSVHRNQQQSKNHSWFVPSSWVLGSYFFP